MKNVTAAAVRAWAKDNMDRITETGHACLSDTARGRLHPEVIAAFNRSHRTTKYDPDTAPKFSPALTVQIMVDTKNGRKVPRKVNLTVAEVKSLTGHNSRGRIPTAVKEAAAFAKIAI